MKIQSKITLAFMAAALTIIITLGYFSFTIIRESLTQQIFNHLNSAANIQKNRIETILDQNFDRLNLLLRRALMYENLENYLTKKSAANLNKINYGLSAAAESTEDVENVSIINSEGEIIASSDNSKIGTKQTGQDYFLEGKKKSFFDVTLDKNGSLLLQFSGPIYHEDKFLGVLLIESKGSYLMSAITDYTGLGKTGETVLAKKDKNDNALYINPLRFYPHASLRKIIPKEKLNHPIVQSLLGKEQIFDNMIDYRDEPVLAATRYLEKIKWGLVTKIDKAEAYAPINRWGSFLFIVVLLLSGTVILISFLIGQAISRPIVKLAGVANDITGGDLSRRAETGGRDEISSMASSFNAMADSLIEARNNLEKKVEEKTAKLTCEIGERKKLEQFKDEMMNVVSHELRLPLTSIKQALYLIMSGFTGELNENQIKILGIAEESVDNLNVLINNILDDAKLKAGKLVLAKKETQINNLISQVAKAYELSAQGRKIKVEQKLYPEIPPINIDPGKISEVLQNLVSNAIKFTPEAGVITISTLLYSDDPRYVEISVQDTGPGIEKNDIDTLFKKFEQLGEGKLGTGLGLNLCKQIVELHNGRIWAESEGCGKGSKFTFILPIYHE